MQPPQDSYVDTDLSSAWMPLDGLIQLWAAFGNNACDGPQTVPVLQATSQAFAALAQERLAFRHYTMMCARRQPPLPPQNQERAWATDDGKLAEPTPSGQGSPIEALQRAAAHWLEAGDFLEQYATHCCQEDESLQHDLRVLMVHARSQRLRVWTIAQHLLQEEVTHARKQYGVLTDLLDDESEDHARTEEKKRP